MWCLGTWFGNGLGSVRFMVGPDDLKGLFQPKLFYDSIWHMTYGKSTPFSSCKYNRQGTQT